MRLRRAAEAGHPPAELAQARYLLDAGATPTQALDWLERAVAHGELAARYWRAALRYAGTCGPPDRAGALADLNESAAAGYAPAEAALAVAWHEEDEAHGRAQASRWLRRAAAHGARVARAMLAVMPPPTEAHVVGEPAPLAAWPRRRFARPLQRLHEAPAVLRGDELLSPAECMWLRTAARPALRPSRILDPATGRPRPDPVRTGTTTYFGAARLDVTTARLAERMALLAGRPAAHAEPLAVLRYLPGEQYRQHHDGLGSTALARDPFGAAGNRAATVLAYLGTPAQGGATFFPMLGLRVEPRVGRLLVFENLGPAGQPAPASLHAGEPVQRGVKWLASLWLRERPLPH